MNKVEISKEELVALEDLIAGHVVYEDPEDDCGKCNFCGVLSFKPHRQHCPVVKMKEFVCRAKKSLERQENGVV